jgi:anti-sigma regulatory factor (Ser/Thr protein kinase)
MSQAFEHREERADRRPALELGLQRDVQAPSRARGAVSEWARELDLGRLRLRTLVLLVSEVVSNAVLHSTGPRDAAITLHAALDGEAIRITVTDPGQGFTPRPRDPGSIHDGYGLYLLEKATSRWGVDPSGPTSVWFELPRGD